MGFKELLNTVRSSCPDVITEEAAADMLQEFNTSMDQIKADAISNGKALGYREGYEEGKKVAADSAKQSLVEALDAHDAEYAEKLAQVIDMLNEQHAEKLQEIYDLLMDTRVAKSEMDNALAEQDEDYANKFSDAIDKIDDVHTAKLEEAVNFVKENIEAKHQKELKKIDEQHSKMIMEAVNAVDDKSAKILEKTAKILNERKDEAIKVITEEITKKYEDKLSETKIISENAVNDLKQQLETEKERKLNIIAESVEKYINYALEERIPEKQIISEQKYNTAIKAVERITDILAVNKVIQESSENFIADYEHQINEAKEAQQKVINENIELTAKVNKLEANLLLESKIQQCTPSEARFLKAHFRNATTPQIIEESIDEAKKAFKNLQNEKRQQLITESAKHGAVSNPTDIVVNEKVDKEPVKENKIITEQAKPANTVSSQDELVQKYAQFLTGKK